MRAVVLGLVGAVLATGGAQAAKECPMNRAIVTVINPHSEYALNEPMKRPDLVGKTFRVARYIEVPRMMRNPATGDMRNAGYEAYELRGAKETFIVKREHVFGSPTLGVLSTTKSDPYIANLNWSAPLPRKPLTIGKYDEEINFGPMSSLALKLKNCR